MGETQSSIDAGKQNNCGDLDHRFVDVHMFVGNIADNAGFRSD